jgi:hypothetical protein
MTRKNEEQDKTPANELASASSSNSALNAAAQQDPNLPAPIVPLAPGGVLLEPNRADPDGLLVEVTYPSMSVDDTIALIFNGEDTLVPQKGNAELKVTFIVPKEYVAKTVGKTVQVSYSVAGNTGAVRSQTLDLDVRLIPVGQLTAPQIVQAVGGVLDVGGLQTAADIFVNAWPLIALKQKTWMQLEGSGNLKLPVWQGYEIGSTGAQVATVQRKDLQNLTDGSQLNLVLEVSFDDGLPLQPFPIRTYQIKTAPEYALGALELVGATGDVIDLGVVSGDPVTVHTHAYIGQTAGDRLLLFWAGVAADGTPLTYSREYTVLAGGEAGEVRFEVPRANLESLGGGTLQLSYQIIKVGGGIQNSPVTSYSVTAVALVLPAPVIVEASDNTLDPLKALEGAKFRVTYPDMQTSDIIKPIWNKIASIIPWRKGEADGTVESTVPATMIGAVIGKTIDISYQVERDGRTYFSDTFNLTVGLIPADKLTTPQITQATGGSLDIGALQGDANITVDAWPFIAIGQKMWMRLEGSSNLDLPGWQGYEISSPGEQATTVSKDDYLINLTDGSTLRLILEVSFDSGLTRLAFPVQNYAVIAKPIPEPLTIDQTPMILDGLYVRGSPEWTLNGNDTAGNTQVRNASGGTPPYTYSSSSTRYASVDSQGKVKGRGWGNSTITVTDALNQNVRYTVNVSNIYVMRQYATWQATHAQAVERSQEHNLQPVERRHISVLATLYGAPFPPDRGGYGKCWCCSPTPEVWDFPSTSVYQDSPSNLNFVRVIGILESLDDPPT